MKKRICSHCNHEIETNASFCSVCGRELPKEKDHTYILVGIIMFLVLLAGCTGVSLLGSDSGSTKNMIVDDLCEIVQDEERAEDYLDTTIHTSGYLFRKDDQIKGLSENIDTGYAISSSAKHFKKKNYVLFELDNVDELNDVGSLSKVSMDGCLKKQSSGRIIFSVDSISVDKKVSKKEGRANLIKKLGLDKKVKKEVKKEEEDTVKEGSTVTVDKLLQDPEKYAGKRLKIYCMLPQNAMVSEDGRVIATVSNMDLDKNIEVRGANPNFGGCEAIVTGTIFLENGTPIINAYSFEAIGQTLSAVTSEPDYYPVTDGYTGPYDIYVANYDMKVRSNHGLNEAQVDTIKQGQYVKIRDCKSDTGSDIWGMIQPGKWVCIEDFTKDMVYFTQVN